MLRGFGRDSGRVRNSPKQSEVSGPHHLQAHSKYGVTLEKVSNPGNQEAPKSVNPERGWGQTPNS